jgi:hypothetical protein
LPEVEGLPRVEGWRYEKKAQILSAKLTNHCKFLSAVRSNLAADWLSRNEQQGDMLF